MWLRVALLLSYSNLVLPHSLIKLASKAMCEAEGCKQNDLLCMEACIPTKLHLISGQVIHLSSESEETTGPERLQLECHGPDRIAVSWCKVPHLIYLVEHTFPNHSGWVAANITRRCSFMLTGLSSNSNYGVSVRGLWTSGQVGKTVSAQFNTTSKELQPSRIASVTVERLRPVDRLFATAQLKWTLSSDLSCQYGLVVWNNRSSSHPTIIDVSFPEELNKKELLGLEFDNSYQLGVTAQNGAELESDTAWLHLHVPPCLHFYPGNLSICKPFPPKNFLAKERLSESGECEVHVSWDKPQFSPSYFSLTVKPFTTSIHYGGHTYNISGDSTETVLKEIAPRSIYVLSVRAVSEGGSSDQVFVKLTDTCSNDLGQGTMVKRSVILTRLAAVLPVFCLLVASIVFFLFFYLKQRTKKLRMRCAHLKSMKKDWKNKEDDCSLADEVDEYEVASDRLMVCDMIGEGAFGVVHKGLLSQLEGPPKQVAIKMLPDKSTSEESRQFQKEIAVMKTVGQHRNIVSLIGCCTQSTRLMLIVEFCPLGDLQNYLRQEWKKLTDTFCVDITSTGDIKYAEIVTANSNGSYVSPIKLSLDRDGSSGLVTNAMYDFCAARDDRTTLSERLLSFARQIAVGMEYLSSNRVVHRDLAARNVLICSDHLVKISDFGLSRDIYEQNIYCKKSSEKLPVKWMALESLLHQVFTTQSDVWSFGVLMWEIVTLGGNPYPSTPTNQMFRLLKHGFRMEQPLTCSNELYSIMMSCWKEKPTERPTFTALVSQLSDLLQAASPHQYLNLNQLIA